MARMIDGNKLVENLRLIATCWSVSPYVSKEKHNGAIDMLREVEREVKKAPLLTPPTELMEALEAINNAAVAYIEGGPYENDLPGMEFALKIDRLSRDFVRPPEGEEDT